MMVYLPALFFGFCLFNSIRKYGWNVEAYIYLLFFITGVASISLDNNNLYQYNCLKMDLGVIAPFLYCFLLWLCIYPFGSNLRRNKIERVVIKNEKIIDLATIFFFVIFIIVVYVASTNINQIILNSSFSEIRKAKYAGDAESFYNHLQGLPRYICALSTFFFASSFFMMVIFFVNVLFRKTKWYLNIMAILGSTVQLVESIYQADRSQFFYWIIMFGLLYTFFYHSIKGKDRIRFFVYCSPLFVIGIAYLIMVSISRWGADSGASDGSMIIYVGQNYFNFCNYFNTFWTSPHSLCELFPLTYYIMGETYWDWCEVVEKQTHIFIMNFSTFLGYICSISGPIVMILYSLFYNRVSTLFLKRKRMATISFWGVTKFWIVALVPACGLFCYHYSFYSTTIALIVWIIIGRISKI